MERAAGDTGRGAAHPLRSAGRCTTGSTSRCGTARCSASSAAPAPASRCCCAICSGCCGRSAGRIEVLGHDLARLERRRATRAAGRPGRAVPGRRPVQLADRGAEHPGAAARAARTCPRSCSTSWPASSSPWSACRPTPAAAIPPSCRAACASAPASPAPSRSIRSSCFSTSRPPASIRSRAAEFDHLIRGLQQSLGLTVVMVTHDLDSLEAICDRVAALVDKRAVVGTLQELRNLSPSVAAGLFPWAARPRRGSRSEGRS